MNLDEATTKAIRHLHLMPDGTYRPLLTIAKPVEWLFYLCLTAQRRKRQQIDGKANNDELLLNELMLHVAAPAAFDGKAEKTPILDYVDKGKELLLSIIPNEAAKIKWVCISVPFHLTLPLTLSFKQRDCVQALSDDDVAQLVTFAHYAGVPLVSCMRALTGWFTLFYVLM